MSTSHREPSPEAQDSGHSTPLPVGNSPRASEKGSAPTSTRNHGIERPKDVAEPPLPAEEPPPLPNEVPPGSQVQDDGWDPVWDEKAQAFYFYNRYTEVSQWENPRIPTITEPAPPGVGNHDRIEPPPTGDLPTEAEKPAGGYDPAIHGDYDPNADYAKASQEPNDGDLAALHPPGTLDSGDAYAATGNFNRFTGKWQVAALNPENFNDENKSRRQMNAYFDVDAAANSHDGKSLKAERSGKKLTKQELKAFKDKRRERKEEKRRAWLRD
jgi:WW domain